MRPLSSALALLLLLHAAPARALNETEFLGYVKYLTKSYMTSFPDEIKRITLAPPEFRDTAGGKGGNAEYDDIKYKVWVSRKKILEAEAEVKACKDISESMTVEYVLAVHFLPTYLHELRHSYRHGTLGEVGNNLEEEVAGFVNGALAYKAAKKNFPDAYKCSSEFSVKDFRIGAIHWDQEGVPGIRKLLKSPKSFYANACSVFDGDAPQCCTLAKARYEKLQPLRDYKLGTDAEAKAACAAVAEKIKDDSCSDLDSAMKLLWDATVIKTFWCSDAAQQRARDYYNKEMERGNAEFRKTI